MGKGALFVTLTSALLFVLGRRHVRRFDEQQRAQHLQETSLKQAAAVFDSTQEGVLVTDPQQHIVHVNPAFSRITGYSTEEVLGQTPKLFASGKHDATFYRQMWQALQDDGVWSGEIWNRRKNGEVYPQWQNLRCIYDNEGQLSHYVAVFSDLSALKRSREELDQLAHFDPLVNLPNRLLFTERAKQDLERARANKRSGALLLIDLDHFKRINDEHGHSSGDACLSDFAERMRRVFRRESDALLRLGGEEFGVLMPGATLDEASALAERFRAELASDGCALHGRRLPITASLGVGSFDPARDDSPEAFFKRVDDALYRAKSEGRDRLALAAPVTDADGARTWRMLSGDAVGTLLGAHAMPALHAAGRSAANSVVSSPQLAALAEANGVRHHVTLTGFKWISRAPDLGFGYEEALGYCVDPDMVRDKDGITAALMAAELAAALKAQGRGLTDALADVDAVTGAMPSAQVSVRVADLSLIARTMTALRQQGPATLAGEPVTVRRDLAAGGRPRLPRGTEATVRAGWFPEA